MPCTTEGPLLFFNGGVKGLLLSLLFLAKTSSLFIICIMENNLNTEFITFDLLSFKSEIELEAFLNFDKDAVNNFFKKLKAVGCINIKITRIWNKGDTYKAMIVYTWKDGEQLKDRKKIFDEFIKNNKFWHQVVVKNEMFESFVVQELTTYN